MFGEAALPFLLVFRTMRIRRVFPPSAKGGFDVAKLRLRKDKNGRFVVGFLERGKHGNVETHTAEAASKGELSKAIRELVVVREARLNELKRDRDGLQYVTGENE